MTLNGKISAFGGPDDPFMEETEGLSFYEHHEADKLPEFFWPRLPDKPEQGTSKRLKNEMAFYIALNVPLSLDRKIAQKSLWEITSSNGSTVVANLVDRGPSAGGRLVDASDAVLRILGVGTNDEVTVKEFTNFNIPFGLYGQVNDVPTPQSA